VKSSSGTTTDTVENGNQGWTADGWKISTGSETNTYQRYYWLEDRQYVGYDATLGQGPYQYSYAYTKPNWVELFQFRPGMLVWFVDDSYADNNTSQHAGGGAAMVVDARPAPFTYPDGSYPSNRRQPFDAAFGLETVPRTCLHKEVLVGKGGSQTVQTLEACAPENAGIAAFDDSDPLRYWSSADPQNSVKVAGAGVKATVTGGTNGFLTVAVQGAQQ
jgi:immune inhibitor A